VIIEEYNIFQVRSLYFKIHHTTIDNIENNQLFGSLNLSWMIHIISILVHIR